MKCFQTKFLKSTAITISIVVSVMCIGGCTAEHTTNDKQTTNNPSANQIVVSVSPTHASLPPGGSQQFTATVQNDPTSRGVSWSVACAAGVDCGVIDATGKFTAPATPPPFLDVTITATSVADSSKKGYAPVSIRVGASSLHLNSATPPSARAGASSFLLTVIGTGFTPESVVRWSGEDRPTNFVSSNTLTVTISAQDVATANVAELTVWSSAPGGEVSNPLLFAINPPVVAVPDRVNLASDGSAVPVTNVISGFTSTGLLVSGGAAISGNGRVVAFVQKDQPYKVLVRDTCAGADMSCYPSTRVASLDNDSVPIALNDSASTPALSYTGRFVAFAPSEDFSGVGFANLGVRDTCLDAAPCVPSTVVAKADSFEHILGGYSGPSANIAPSLSSDGRYVALINGYWGLSDGLAFTQVFTWDSCMGAPAGCVLSQNQVRDENGNSVFWSYSSSRSVSANGRYVVFVGYDFHSVGQPSRPGTWLRDTCAGVSGCTPSSRRISTGINYGISVSANGRFVALDAGVLDTCLDAAVECTPSTMPYALNSAGQRFTGNSWPAISAEGRWIAFQQSYFDYFYSREVSQVLVRDTCRGVPNCTPASVLLSQGGDGAPGDASSYAPAISADGRFVVFTSAARNLVADGNNQVGIFRATIGAATK